MRFNRLDLNLLVALDALLTLKSVSLAAQKLNLSQSAMSNALARLREHFEDELLVPSGRTLHVTPRASLLQGAVRDILIRVDTTICAPLIFNPKESTRQFRIFLSDFTMITLMPHLMALCNDRAPRVTFDFLPQSNDPQKLLERDEADLLIIPNFYCDNEHPHEVLFSEEFRCVVWTKGAFAKVTNKMSLKAFQEAGHVVMKPPGSAPSFEGTIIEQNGIARRVEVQTFSFFGALSLVVGTDRIATVHRRLAEYGENVLPLKVLQHPVKFPSMQQAMQWQRFRTNDPGLIWLRQLMKEAVTRMDAHLFKCAAIR
jgi:LysR family transcriptional regulator, nod-box dependent transcriptional activator